MFRRKRRLPKSLTTVTTLSKIIALILFISMPFIGFYLGRNYQKGIDDIRINSLTEQVSSYSALFLRLTTQK